MTKYQVAKNDHVVLISKSRSRPNSKSIGQRFCLTIEDQSQKIHGLGVYNPAKFVGLSYGSTITLGQNQYWLLPATALDQVDTIRRKAQIVIPKDAALIGLYCDIRAGSQVVEGGVGSGALTIILLSLVGPNGQVTSYETRDDFAKIGKNNIEKTGLGCAWKLKLQDISQCISETDQDAVVLDIPEPWTVVDIAYRALRPGGILAGYTPTINQVEKFVISLKTKPFIEIHTFETLQRELVVKPGSVRPSFDMLGHTGYITVARKVLEM